MLNENTKQPLATSLPARLLAAAMMIVTSAVVACSGMAPDDHAAANEDALVYCRPGTCPDDHSCTVRNGQPFCLPGCSPGHALCTISTDTGLKRKCVLPTPNECLGDSGLGDSGVADYCAPDETCVGGRCASDCVFF